MLDIKQLNYAIALATHRNFARAAEALNMSQPALSRSISRLESDLGVRLFDRTRQGVVPTPFGERLVARGAILLRDGEEIEREIKLLRGVEVGVLRVGAGIFPADISVGLAVARLATQYPRLCIEVATGVDWRSAVESVLGTELDLAVCELSEAEQEPRLQVEPLPEHRAVFFCRTGHPLVQSASFSAEVLSAFPLVCVRLPARAARLFYRLSKTGTIDPDTGDYMPPIRADTLPMICTIVRSSDAIGIAPGLCIAAAVRAGEFAALPISAPWLHTRYGFVFRRDRMLAPAAQAFMAEVRNVEKELEPAESRAWAGLKDETKPALVLRN